MNVTAVGSDCPYEVISEMSPVEIYNFCSGLVTIGDCLKSL
jgi:hypothetical protein